MLDPQSARDRVGTVLDDKYRLDTLLGLGGMGAVYRGVHRWTERPVAVKLLFDDVSKNKESVERFFREARALSRVGHKGIVQVLDLGRTSDDTLYLVQELLDGETLRAHLDRSVKLSLTECARIALPVLDALDAAHAAGMVHRDVKPENIVLHREPRGGTAPKLIDFGVARLDAKGLRLTRAGSVLGTPHYMAPEQIRGELDIDARADLWSVGVVLFECASGRRPYSADNMRELFAKVALEPVPSLRAVAPDAPEPFVRLVDRALAKEPARRWPSARAMLIELACISEVRKDPALAGTLAALGLDPPSAKTAIAGSAFVPVASPARTPTPQPIDAVNAGPTATDPDDATQDAHAQPMSLPSPTLASRPAIVSAPPTRVAAAKQDPKLGRVALAISLASAVLVVASYTLRPSPDPARAPTRENTIAPVATPDSGVASHETDQRPDATTVTIATVPASPRDAGNSATHVINVGTSATDAGRAGPRRPRPNATSMSNGFID